MKWADLSWTESQEGVQEVSGSSITHPARVLSPSKQATGQMYVTAQLTQLIYVLRGKWSKVAGAQT